jgi:SsrA-binding protein
MVYRGEGYFVRGVKMSKQKSIKPVVSNRKARYNYHIKETYEAGLVLAGTEVKSLRMGKGNLQDAYATVRDGEVWVNNFHISPYDKGNRFNHDPLRPKKLLLNRREIKHLLGMHREKGYTLIPLQIYFKNGLAKMELAVAVGKKLHDKREDIAARDAKRAIERALKDRSRQ